MSNFAQTTRYHNLDALSAAKVGKDPLAHWDEIIHAILIKDVPRKRQMHIIAVGSAIAAAIDSSTSTIMQSLDQHDLSTEQALVLPGLHDQASKYAILRLIVLLAPIRSLISDISHKAYPLGVSRPPFPPNAGVSGMDLRRSSLRSS